MLLLPTFLVNGFALRFVGGLTSREYKEASAKDMLWAVLYEGDCTCLGPLTKFSYSDHNQMSLSDSKVCVHLLLLTM